MVEEAESGEKMKEGRERGERGRKRGGEKRGEKELYFQCSISQRLLLSAHL